MTHQHEKPLSRQSLSDVTLRCQEALEKPISQSTVGRILREAAIKPWQFRYWIFPRVEGFAEQAGPILDLYQKRWKGRALAENEFVISADEKTSIQARGRANRLGPGPDRPFRIEHEYERLGAWQYLAAFDVHRGVAMGRCEDQNGIASFRRLVEQVMTKEPYASAKQVYWIVDNGSAHRAQSSVDRLTAWFPNAKLLHTPVHASWLNQVEIYFSIVQRKVLTPNDFSSREELADRLSRFEAYWNVSPSPFDWNFTRTKMKHFLDKYRTKPLAV